MKNKNKRYKKDSNKKGTEHEETSFICREKLLLAHIVVIL